MTIHTFSSREFTRDVSAAKRAASDGAVLITDRGRPAFALLTIEEYYRLTEAHPESFLQVMDAIPCMEGIEFDPPKLDVRLRSADVG